MDLVASSTKKLLLLEQITYENLEELQEVYEEDEVVLEGVEGPLNGNAHPIA